MTKRLLTAALPTLWVALYPKEKALGRQLFEPKEGWELSTPPHAVYHEENHLYNLFKLTHEQNGKSIKEKKIEMIKILEYSAELFLMSENLAGTVLATWCLYFDSSPLNTDSICHHTPIGRQQYSRIKQIIELMKKDVLMAKNKAL